MTSSWNRVRVFATWLEQDGTPKGGTYKVTIPVRVTSDTDNVIIPAGVFAQGNLNTQPDVPSLSILVPATDDPDINETGWKVAVDITFTTGGSEKYILDIPIANRPTADGGNDAGVNLEKYIFPASIPQSSPLFKIGVPGGLAKLNLDGDVVNADGTVAGGLATVTAADITDASTVGRNALKAATMALARTAIGAGTSNFDGAYSSLSGKPTIPTAPGDIGAATAAQGTKADTAVQPARTVAGHPLSADVVVTKSDVSLGNVDNTSDLNKPVSTATQTALNDKADAADLAAKADLVGGLVPSAQIPAVAITEFLGNSANQAAMLALTGQKGDWTIRTDLGTTWLITGSDPTQLASWTALSYPTAPVTSVSGRTGVITLAKADVGLGSVDNTADSAKAVLSATKLTTARTINGISFDGTANIEVLAASTHAATSKTTPVDADELALVDSAATFGLKRLTIANLKALFDSTGVAKLKTARTINGVSFDGTANISVRLDQLAAPTANVAMGTRKFTGLAPGTATGDSANWDQFDALDSGKLNADPDAMSAIRPNMVVAIWYDATNGWVFPNGEDLDANLTIWFIGGDDAHAPPSVAGKFIWDEPA